MSDSRRAGGSADILLVEDDPGDARLTKEAFTEGQICNPLHVVADGIGADGFLYRRGDHANAPCPDHVLLGPDLPRRNGDEVCEEINDDSVHSRIPLITPTRSAVEGDVVSASHHYTNAYHTKPVEPETLNESGELFQLICHSTVRLPPCEEQ